ncbi:uncharacterized protein CC84DRAFT_494595 [Paraphaeosphaeria sporulosa]|uniref:Uncharacterized protein n=1 Tax=Paraphaeosphaeria sporulosa TaxID=1460663 RepID=A0A177CTC7_9PLEO|nr:uncharacterized protein CC84DRAFT_494595 [Paraphaeosphaeria sporulosa]OAG10783.1 hypothetical protein CC84DRAFT_494595 [Paraphaeosphaeria sporulosa]
MCPWQQRPRRSTGNIGGEWKSRAEDAKIHPNVEPDMPVCHSKKHAQMHYPCGRARSTSAAGRSGCSFPELLTPPSLSSALTIILCCSSAVYHCQIPWSASYSVGNSQSAN